MKPGVIFVFVSTDLRERVPLQWAGTQMNLGLALLRLGERESGTGKLTEAVAAYRAALEEDMLQTDPTNCQLTMENLNQVLTLQKKKSRKEGSQKNSLDLKRLFCCRIPVHN